MRETINKKYLVTFTKCSKTVIFPIKKQDSKSTFYLYSDYVDYNNKIKGYVYSVRLNINIPMGCIGLIIPTESNDKYECYYPNSTSIIYPGDNNDIKVTFKPNNKYNTRGGLPYYINAQIAELVIVKVPLYDFMKIIKVKNNFPILGKDIIKLIKKKK